MNIINRIRHKLKMPIYLGLRIRQEWLGYTKFYLVYCIIHKEWFEASPSGYEEILYCPKCLKDRLISNSN